MTKSMIIILFGLYAAGGTLALLLSPARMVRIIGDFRASPGLCYVTGALMVVMGGAILLHHLGFGDFRTGLVTLLGAALLIEGALFMSAPRSLLSLAEPFARSDALMRGLGLVSAGFAAWLLWLGHFGAAS